MKKSPGNERAETLDTLFAGRLKILQKKDGYRFSIDALLLARFVQPRRTDRVIDLGTGCGVIPLILLFRREAQKVIGVEIQPALAEIARRNAALNRFVNRFPIWEKDLKTLRPKSGQGNFDLVLTNPPYRKVGSGRVNPEGEKAVARHELNATLTDVLRTASFLLKPRGRLCLIYPASRAPELIQAIGRFHLEPKRLQFVHSHHQDKARLLLVEARKEGRAQAQVLPPFFLYESTGESTPEAQALFR